MTPYHPAVFFSTKAQFGSPPGKCKLFSDRRPPQWMLFVAKLFHKWRHPGISSRTKTRCRAGFPCSRTADGFILYRLDPVVSTDCQLTQRKRAAFVHNNALVIFQSSHRVSFRCRLVCPHGSSIGLGLIEADPLFEGLTFVSLA